MMTDMLHTIIDTATSTHPVREGRKPCSVSPEFKSACDMREGAKVAAPKIASQKPGLVITRTACVRDASVVAIDAEKIENKRKRNARMWTPRTI